jgi:neurofibromin 1
MFLQKMQASHREADIRDLVITGLSHLVTSNSENAVKHCIASVYDSDMRKRTIFVNVFARVLGQGTKFEAQGNPELQARRNQLREVCFRPFTFFRVQLSRISSLSKDRT